MCVCVCMYACICVCMFMYVCVRICVCMYVFMYVWVYVCVYVCMYVCVCMCMYACICTYVYYVCVYVYACMCVCIRTYVCIQVCVYVYVYVCRSMYMWFVHAKMNACIRVCMCYLCGFRLDLSLNYVLKFLTSCCLLSWAINFFPGCGPGPFMATFTRVRHCSPVWASRNPYNFENFLIFISPFKCYLIITFSGITFMQTSFFVLAPYPVPLSSFFVWFEQSCNIWWRLQIRKLFISHFLHTPISSSFWSEYSRALRIQKFKLFS
jgi:hypothetical protein